MCADEYHSTFGMCLFGRVLLVLKMKVGWQKQETLTDIEVNKMLDLNRFTFWKEYLVEAFVYFWFHLICWFYCRICIRKYASQFTAETHTLLKRVKGEVNLVSFFIFSLSNSLYICILFIPPVLLIAYVNVCEDRERMA